MAQGGATVTRNRDASNDIAAWVANFSPDTLALNADKMRPAADDATTLEANAGALGGSAPLEHDEQSALFEWANAAQGEHPELCMLFAIPNGGARHPAVAAQLKAEGVKAGVPDIFLAVARGRWHGLFVELKRADRSNHATSAQRAWMEMLRRYGYSAIVCYGATDAINAIMGYLTQGDA